MVNSVGLLHFVSFTALIGWAYRHPPVCLSLVVKPAFPRLLIPDTSPTKKATIKAALFVGELGGIRTRDPLIKSQTDVLILRYFL